MSTATAVEDFELQERRENALLGLLRRMHPDQPLGPALDYAVSQLAAFRARQREGLQQTP